MNTSAPARIHMTQSQLLTGNVLDEAILNAIGQVPREAFAPVGLGGAAYVDEDIALGGGRSLLEPLVFARLLAMANIKMGDRVLDLACGTGYSTAVIAHLCSHATGVDDAFPAVTARQVFTELGIANAEIVSSTPVFGYKHAAPYDVIFIGGGVQQVPEALVAQLAPEGRLVAVQTRNLRPGGRSGLGQMMSLTKSESALIKTYGMDASVPLLQGFEAKPQFIF